MRRPTSAAAAQRNWCKAREVYAHAERRGPGVCGVCGGRKTVFETNQMRFDWIFSARSEPTVFLVVRPCVCVQSVHANTYTQISSVHSNFGVCVFVCAHSNSVYGACKIALNSNPLLWCVHGHNSRRGQRAKLRASETLLYFLFSSHTTPAASLTMRALSLSV